MSCRTPVSRGATFVLVAGEARELQGNKHAERDFQHTSLPFIGSAYEALRNAGIERDQIIVIAQLNDYLTNTLLAWERTAPESQKKFIRDQHSRTVAACSRLIDEGGVDYDNDEVNPSTVLNVLAGRRGKHMKRVVRETQAGPVILAIYSHGDSHLAVPFGGSAFHSSSNAEWFCHMPYPSPRGEEKLDFVSTAGSGVDEKTGASRAPCLLYSTQLVLTFQEIVRKAPQRPLVALLNYCRSGGSCGFMHRAAAIQQLGLDEWPLYLMCSSGAHSDSLVGGFWDAWFSSLASKLTDERQLISSPSISPKPLSCSIEDLFGDAAARYARLNVYELTNEVKECAYSCQVWQHEFHFPGRKAGEVDPWHVDLQRCLVAGPGSSPDMRMLKELEDAYRTGRAFRLISRAAAAASGIDLSAGVADFVGPHKRTRRKSRVEEREEFVVIWAGREAAAAARTDRLASSGAAAATAAGRDSSSGVAAPSLTDVPASSSWWREVPGSLPLPCELTAWKGKNEGSAVDLPAVVTECLERVARPGRVFGSRSEVASTKLSSFFR